MTVDPSTLRDAAALTAFVAGAVQLLKPFIPDSLPGHDSLVRLLAVALGVLAVAAETSLPPHALTALNEGVAIGAASVGAYAGTQAAVGASKAVRITRTPGTAKTTLTE